MTLHNFGVQVIWIALQVTLLLALGAAAYLLSRRAGPAVRSLLAAGTLAVSIGMTALAIGGWPTWYHVSFADAPLTSAHRGTENSAERTAANGSQPTDLATRDGAAES